jgi:hypothetical protein
MLKFSYIVFYEKQIFVTISTNDSVDTERLAETAGKNDWCSRDYWRSFGYNFRVVR